MVLFSFFFLAGVFRFMVRHYMTTKIHTGTRFIPAGHGSSVWLSASEQSQSAFSAAHVSRMSTLPLATGFADAHSSAPFDPELRNYAYLDTETGSPTDSAYRQRQRRAIFKAWCTSQKSFKSLEKYIWSSGITRRSKNTWRVALHEGYIHSSSSH